MIFESLHESNERGELLLIDGGYCRWHLRRDGTVTIYEVLSQRPGAGQELLARLPAGRTETTPGGRTLNVWQRSAH